VRNILSMFFDEVTDQAVLTFQPLGTAYTS
jgi:hypothetical protein